MTEKTTKHFGIGLIGFFCFMGGFGLGAIVLALVLELQWGATAATFIQTFFIVLVGVGGFACVYYQIKASIKLNKDMIDKMQDLYQQEFNDKVYARLRDKSRNRTGRD